MFIFNIPEIKDFLTIENFHISTTPPGSVIYEYLLVGLFRLILELGFFSLLMPCSLLDNLCNFGLVGVRVLGSICHCVFVFFSILPLCFGFSTCVTVL